MAYAGIGRALIRAAPYLTGLAYDLYTLTERIDAPTGFTARRCQAVLARNNSEDVVTNTFDIVNITSGAPDSSWTPADYVTVEGRLRTFYNAMAGIQPTNVSLREFRWHILPDVPGDTAAVRVAPPSPGVAGTASTSLPPQVAMSVTKVTASRKHWGRIYVGPLQLTGSIATGVNGRFNTSQVDTVATAFNTLRAGLQADDFPMVVFDRTRLHFATVDGVRCDDIPDVIRSRRPDWVPYRKVLP